MKMRVIAVRSALATSVLAFGMIAYAGDTYHVTLLKPSVVGGQELKPGDYKVEVKNDTAIISHGKKSVETKIKAESVDKKYDSTTVHKPLFTWATVPQKTSSMDMANRTTVIRSEASGVRI